MLLPGTKIHISAKKKSELRLNVVSEIKQMRVLNSNKNCNKRTSKTLVNKNVLNKKRNWKISFFSG